MLASNEIKVVVCFYVLTWNIGFDYLCLYGEVNVFAFSRFQINVVANKTDSTPASALSATRQHLTLEEKQKLAKASEMQHRMKTQGELKPQLLHNAGLAKKRGVSDNTFRNLASDTCIDRGLKRSYSGTFCSCFLSL